MSSRNSLEKAPADIKAEDAYHVETRARVVEIGNFRVCGISDEDADFFRNFPEQDRKKVFRKVDIRLVPMLACLYLICHVDRANIGNAKIEGMIADLNMTGVQYNTVLAICKYISRVLMFSIC
jgi:hypothetical protein